MQKYIIYGAGTFGKSYYEFLKKKHLESYIDSFCDRRANEIKDIFGLPVVDYQTAKKKGLDFIVSIGKADGSDELVKIIEKDGLKAYLDLRPIAILENAEWSKWENEMIGISHDTGFNYYFDEAENNLEGFWDENSLYRKLFNRLDVENIVELACGHGRHVQKYLDLSKSITLVDILDSNIEYCKNRYKGIDKIEYMVNNGSDFSALESGKYTAVFSYASMIHFEMLDIYSYLKDTYRILANGGRALYHHSNNTSDYKISFSNTQLGRNFMSKEIFAYMAYRCGFNVLEQEIISYNGNPLDCLTLIEKPSLRILFRGLII